MSSDRMIVPVKPKAPILLQDSGSDPLSYDELKEMVFRMREAAEGDSDAESTKAAYKGAYRVYICYRETFSDTRPLNDFECIADFLCVYAEGRSPVTVRNMYSAIRYHLLCAGHECDYTIAIKHLLMGLRRIHGRPANRKLPVGTEIIRQICRNLDDRGGIKSLRDKCLLLIGYGGALRASEAVGVDLEHLTIDHRGITIHIPKSKTDQVADGQDVTIPRTTNPATCPVVAVEEWRGELIARRGPQGPLLPVLRRIGDPALHQVRPTGRRLSTSDYREILKTLCGDVGLDRTKIGGHSLRSGHATEAAENGASPFEIAAQGRWRSLQMVMVYVRMGKRFKNNSANYLGL